jgi:hypothetical protein
MKPHRFTDDNLNAESCNLSGGNRGLSGENHGQESPLARNLEQLSVLRTGKSDLPSSCDLNEPEMAELSRLLEEVPQAAQALGRVQQLDVLLQHGMDDVPVPTGLADRLLARLAEDRVTLSATEAAAVAAPSAEQHTQPASRRRWLAWGAALAASLLVALGIWQSMKPTPFAAADIETLAHVWQEELTENWKSLPIPKSFTVPESLRGLEREWQRLQIDGAAAVAIRLGRNADDGTVLFLIDRQLDPPAPSSPPKNPQWTTGGWSIAYWHERQQLNVLLVDGGEAEYKQFIPPGSGALAMVYLPASAIHVVTSRAA